MSKGENNKGGTVLADGIYEICGNILSENAKPMNYKREFRKKFGGYFSEYFRIITGKEIMYGSLSDEDFDWLKEKLKKVVKGYPMDKLYVWFNVKSWQDLFPTYYKNFAELEFKKKMNQLIMDFFEKIEGEKKTEKFFGKKMFEIRKMIYKLMEIDYYYQEGYKDSSQTIRKILNIEREMEKIERKTEEMMNKAAVILKVGKKRQQKVEQESFNIVEYLESGLEPREKSENFMKLYEKCKKRYIEDKVNFEEVDILKWVDEQR